MSLSTKSTTAGEPIIDGLPICVPKVLMPKDGISLDKWATVACDQFEENLAYWKGMSDYVGKEPSVLNIIFPEVYLASVTGADPSEDAKRIDEIGKCMKKYVADGVFADKPAAFIALDRKTPQVPTRKGLIMAVDLEEYNYNCPKPTMIRPTEKTVPERLPPRIAIRKDAPLELPHIIMIIDDPKKTVIEPLFTKSGLSTAEYECSLFQEAGTVKGLRVTDEGTAHVVKTMKALAGKEMKAAKKGKREAATILIGDGNHSLATAKSCWETLKKDPSVDKKLHPARFALVELQNLHDDGVVFEPIHRILTTDAAELQSTLEKEWGVKATPFTDPAPLHSIVIMKKEGDALKKYTLIPPAEALPVVSMTKVVDEYLKKTGCKISYVHGEEDVEESVKGGSSVGLLLPKLDKTRFLETIHAIGTLPRKAFSMGEANEKRFYIEARAIL
jgi:hypothetical protein